MGRNFLKGIIGDQINAMMAAAAWNFKKWMRENIQTFLCQLYFYIQKLFMVYKIRLKTSC
jgi:hypothetical protein